jgi:hypothetical protein
LFIVVVRVAGMRYWWTMLLGEEDLVTKEDMRNLGRAVPWLTVQQGCVVSKAGTKCDGRGGTHPCRGLLPPCIRLP